MIYGAKKDPYRPDVVSKMGAAVLPDEVDMSEYLPGARYQQSLNACVGFAIGAQLTGLAKKRGVYTEWFSPMWVWNGARFIEGTLTENVGVYPRDAFDWIKEKGSLLEQFWRFTGQMDASAPSSEDSVEAKKLPIIERYRVTGNQNDICSALAQGNFVCIGTPWFAEWETIFPDGKLPVATKKSRVGGFHETLLYGYDRKAGMFKGLNSWGLVWGRLGHYDMPFESFDIFGTFGGWDAMYCTVPWPEQPKKKCWLKNLLKQ